MIGKQPPNQPQRSKLGYRALSLALPVALLMVWWAASSSWPATPRYATPPGVVVALKELWSRGDLQVGTLVSLKHVLVGFVAAGLLGTVLGLLMGYRTTLDSWAAPLFNTLRPIAPYAWIPLAILWFGTGDMTAFFVVGYAAFFPMLMNAINGARGIDRNLVSAARALGARQTTIFWRVLIPAALPSVLVGARLSMGAAWIAVVAAEMATGTRGGLTATGGLGQMMFVFYAYHINLNNIVACIIFLGILALLSDRLLHWVYRRVTPWAQGQ